MFVSKKNIYVSSINIYIYIYCIFWVKYSIFAINITKKLLSKVILLCSPFWQTWVPSRCWLFDANLSYKRNNFRFFFAKTNSWKKKRAHCFKSRIFILLNIIIISNVICYTMLCMLEWIRKGKHRIGTPRTRGLRGSTLTAYIHGGIP